MKHYRVNKQVFATEEEARQYSKDLMAYGGLGGWSETDEPFTHIYLGDLKTQPYNELDFYITPYEAQKYCAECDKPCTRDCDIMIKAYERYKESLNG